MLCTQAAREEDEAAGHHCGEERGGGHKGTRGRSMETISAKPNGGNGDLGSWGFRVVGGGMRKESFGG